MTKDEMVFAKLNEMKLSDKARDFIAKCDQEGVMYFADMETAEEVEAFVDEYGE